MTLMKETWGRKKERKEGRKEGRKGKERTVIKKESKKQCR